MKQIFTINVICFIFCLASDETIMIQFSHICFDLVLFLFSIRKCYTVLFFCALRTTSIFLSLLGACLEANQSLVKGRQFIKGLVIERDRLRQSHSQLNREKTFATLLSPHDRTNAERFCA